MICRDISRPLASELRFWSVIGTADAGMVALFVFALSLRVDSVSLRVLRGARLQAGRQGLKAFARAAAAECQVHKGVALVPSVPLGREIANIEIAPSDLGNRQQTKLQGSREFRQGLYHEMIDAAVGADVGGLSRRSPRSRRGLRMLKPAHLSDEAATDVPARSYL